MFLGFMHWWGLTIDITSMSVLIISVGLCVDFCAHIVHGFLYGKGTRHERVVFVMENIAPAVMNGGFSSILALSLLATSRSHIFVSFFKGRTRLLPFMIEINQRSEFLRRI
jgi:Niemann-Pick C1 protein